MSSGSKAKPAGKYYWHILSGFRVEKTSVVLGPRSFLTMPPNLVVFHIILESQLGMALSENRDTPSEKNESSEPKADEASLSEAVLSDGQAEEIESEAQSMPAASSGLSTIAPVRVAAPSIITVLLVVSVLLNIFLLIFNEAPAPAKNGPFPLIIALGMILVSVISLAIAFWANHARSIYLKDGPALVPERWGMLLHRFTKVFEIQQFEAKTSLATLQTSTELAAEKSNELLKSFLKLQEALSERDIEIARLKKGHDAKVFKRFLKRFIRVDRSLGEMEKEFADPTHQKNYQYLKRIMQDALEECGIEEYWPNAGTDYRDAGPQIADDPAIIETKDKSQDFIIAEVVSKGYVIAGEGDGEVIVPARVSIFRAKKDMGEELDG